MSLPILPFYTNFKSFTDQLHLYYPGIPVYDPKESWKDYVKSIYLGVTLPSSFQNLYLKLLG